MNADSIVYRVRFSRAAQHLTDIEASFPVSETCRDGDQRLTIMLPVWTPGSYLVREYSRNIESIMAFDDATGQLREIHKTSKNRWSIDARGSHRVRVRYSLYCRESSVRTNWVDEEYAFLTGAATFITLTDYPSGASDYRVELEPLDNWPHIACSLPASDSHLSGGDRALEPVPLVRCFSRSASSYDELVDSPILMGELELRTFDVRGVTHYLACLGTQGEWDHDRAASDCQKIVATQHAFWAMSLIPVTGLSTCHGILRRTGTRQQYGPGNESLDHAQTFVVSRMAGAR